MAEPRSQALQRAVSEVVEHQLREGTPPETGATLARLVAGGSTRERAVERIAGAVEAEMAAVLRTRGPFDQARFAAALRSLGEEPADRAPDAEPGDGSIGGGGQGVGEDEAFLAAIRAQPADSTARLVYADWLDERDDPRGGYLRLLCAAAGWAEAAESLERVVARLQQLRAEYDPGWLAAVQHGVGWRTLFEANLSPYGEREYGELYEFGPPATAEQLTHAEAVLGVRLPAEVRELLSEFNGVWSTVGTVSGGRSEPDILYLDTEHMTVDVPQHFRTYSEGGDNWHPPLEELRRVVFVCHSNGFQRLWGVCTGDVAGYRAGEVVKLDPDDGGWETSHRSLAEFVRTGYK